MRSHICSSHLIHSVLESDWEFFKHVLDPAKREYQPSKYYPVVTCLWYLKTGSFPCTSQGRKHSFQGHSLLCCGRGVTQSYTEAFKYLRLAADEGLAKAQFNLGVCYENGQEVPQSSAKAIKYYTFAADQGLVEAQRKLNSKCTICFLEFSVNTEIKVGSISHNKLSSAIVLQRMSEGLLSELLS